MTQTSGWQETSLFFPYRSIAVYLPRNYTTALDALIQVVVWPKVHARRKNKDLLFLPRFHKHIKLSILISANLVIHSQSAKLFKNFFKTRKSYFLVFVYSIFCSLNRYSANFFESKSGKANKYYFKIRDNYNIARL